METNRLEAFSDGVFAIAITLLVLDIGVPAGDSSLAESLLLLWPSYLAYAVSFLVIGAIWINHHAMFRHIVRADGTLLLLNVLHLMFIAFVPFPTAVLAEAFHRGVGEQVATAFYGGTLTVIGLFVTAMWRYAAHEHRLLGAHLTVAEARRISRRFLVGPLAYAFGTVIALALPWLALLLYLCLNLFYLWPRRSHEGTPTLGTGEGQPPPAPPTESSRGD